MRSVGMRRTLDAAARVCFRPHGFLATSRTTTSAFSFADVCRKDDAPDFGSPPSLHRRWTSTWSGKTSAASSVASFAQRVSTANERVARRSFASSPSTSGTDDLEKPKPISIQPWSREDVVTLPNFISTARGVFGPVLGVAYVTEAVSPEFVFAGVVVAAVSDWLDGYVARRMHLRSVSGTYLDPLGDKLFVASLAAALAAKGGVPIWLAGSIVARDVSLIAGAWIQRGRALEWRWDTWGQFFAGTRDARFGDAGGCAKERRAGGDGVDDGKKKSPKTLKPRLRNAPAVPPMRPELLGKVTTTAQFVLFGSALAHGISGGETPSKEVMETIFGVAGVATFASGASYFFRKDAFARNA